MVFSGKSFTILRSEGVVVVVFVVVVRHQYLLFFKLF